MRSFFTNPGDPGRSRRWLLRLLPLVALVAFIAPSTARARPPPRAADGPGIKVGGNSRFHPGFALVTGVDTNVFYAKKGPEAVRPGAFILPVLWASVGNRRVIDGVLQSPPERTERWVDYNLAAIVGFRQFMSSRESLRTQSRLTAGVVLRASFLPGRRFSADLGTDFYRLAEPRNFEAGGAFTFNRIDWKTSLLLVARPGGGRLSLSLGLLFEWLKFENDDFKTLRNNRMVPGFLHEGKWRFLPRSALLYRYSMNYTYYNGCCVEVGFGRNEDNFAHRLLGGYNGVVGKRWVMEGLVGFGWGKYRQDPNGPNFSSVIGRGVIDFYPTQRTRLRASFERGFSDSLFGNYFVDLTGRLEVSHDFKWRMTFQVGGGVIGRRYRGLPEPGVEDRDIAAYGGLSGPLTRKDILATVDAKLEQAIGRLFALAATYSMQIDETDFTVRYTSGSVDYGGFRRHLVMLFGAVRY